MLHGRAFYKLFLTRSVKKDFLANIEEENEERYVGGLILSVGNGSKMAGVGQLTP